MSALTMDGTGKPRGKKSLKTYSRKNIRPVAPEEKKTEKLPDELARERFRSTSGLATKESLERDGGRQGEEKRKRETPARLDATSTVPSPKKTSKQYRSIRRRVLAKKAAALPTPQDDDSWIYASPIQSSNEVCTRDQTNGQGDDIEPTPIPSNHSSSRKIRASKQKGKKIRILTLRQQLALPIHEKKSISVHSKSSRLKRSKKLNVIHSPVRRGGIRDGGDGFLSSELLPPSAKKRRLNGRPKASSFYISGSGGLELAKGPLPAVRFLNVFELEQEREGVGMLQLARSKTVASESTIPKGTGVESEQDSTRRNGMTRDWVCSSADDIYFGAPEQGSNDETSIEQQSPGVIRRLGRSSKGITPIPERTEGSSRRLLSENLLTASAYDVLLADTNHDLLFANSQFDVDDTERVTQVGDDEDLRDDGDSNLSRQRSGITQESRASENALCHASPLSPHSSSSPSASTHSPTPSSSPPQPDHSTIEPPHACQRSIPPPENHRSKDAYSADPSIPPPTEANQQHFSNQNGTHKGYTHAPLSDPHIMPNPALSSTSLSARSQGHRSRRTSHKTILFDNDVDSSSDGVRNEKMDEETYFDLLLSSLHCPDPSNDDDKNESCFSSPSSSDKGDLSSLTANHNAKNNYSPHSGNRNDHRAPAEMTRAKAVQVRRSSMVMETSPQLRTGRSAGSVQVPRTSVVVETSPSLGDACGDGMLIDERGQIREERHREAVDAAPESGQVYGGRVVVDVFSSLRQIYEAGLRGSTVSLH